MSIHDEIATDFSEILQEFGKIIIYEDREIAALISEPMLSSELVLGGEVDDIRFTAKVLRSSLSELPRSGQIVHWNHADYRIKAAMSRPPHAIVTLELGPVDP
ncbi:hypothetical protein [Prosthecobacter sp.]|uniref:hypothetical protein n=1 Tax=Prosthecobacter sp. TaxID=1965333 RepID=UPI001DAF49A1|nr:hypothetical protein [Prosthecobacter sp.]MCB1275989.1 hypothetical protein [Prosthecobacter sp.]